ncbi:MAG: hypothetical protein Q4C56_08630 [Peptococcaceae bacterium]|nr:hypothetical protein [Peptococcaceae bacterium]
MAKKQEEPFDIEKTDQARALFGLITAEEKNLVRRIIDRVENATLMPEQKVLIQLKLLEEMRDAVAGGGILADFVGDEAHFVDDAIAEIGEEVRQQRHIGALMGGIALCAIILLLRSAADLVMGLVAGESVMNVLTHIDLGHVICIIAILLSTRLLVVGDKKASYNDPRKANRRMQFVGAGILIGLFAMALPFFTKYVILAAPSVYILALAIILLILWKLSGRL